MSSLSSCAVHAKATDHRGTWVRDAHQIGHQNIAVLIAVLIDILAVGVSFHVGVESLQLVVCGAGWFHAIRVGKVFQGEASVTGACHSDTIFTHWVVSIVRVRIILKGIVAVVLGKVVNKFCHSGCCNKLHMIIAKSSKHASVSNPINNHEELF